jgi:hypothetical protein
LHTLRQAIAERLLSNNVVISEDADVELKIKFMRQYNRDVILIQQRDAASKHKINEKLMRYYAETWIQDVAENSALLIGDSEYAA